MDVGFELADCVVCDAVRKAVYVKINQHKNLAGILIQAPVLAGRSFSVSLSYRFFIELSIALKTKKEPDHSSPFSSST